MYFRDFLVILRDFTYYLAWFVGLVFLFSGVQDLVYDIGAYSLRLFRRIYYRNRERLTLVRLRDREQQRIAVMVPAWNEGEVVGMMVKNILERVEYRNYLIFVGTYPNDQRTQDAVNRRRRKAERRSGWRRGRSERDPETYRLCRPGKERHRGKVGR